MATTNLDSFAYTWDTPENCVMTKLLTQDAKMLHYPSTTGQKENQFLFPSEFNDSGNGMNIKLEVFQRVLDKCYDRIPIIFIRSLIFLDPINRETFDFAPEIPCLGHYTNVFQIDLEKDNSWYQHLLHPMPFIKPLLFKPTELGHNTQFSVFETKRARMYTPKQSKNSWDIVIHASAS